MGIRHLLLAVICGNAAAQTPAPATALPPASAFYSWSEMEEVQLSPSGRHLALTTAKIGGRRGLYVFDLSPGGQPTQAALYRDVDIVDVHWVSDERLIYRTVDRALPGHSMGHRRSLLYAVDRDGRNERSLGGYALLAVPEDGSGEVLVAERRGGGSRPLRVNTRNGLSKTLENLRLPSDRIQSWGFDSLGRPRIAASFDPDTYIQRIWARPDLTGDWKQIAEGPALDMPFSPVFTDDLGTLYVSEPSGPGRTAVIKRFDFKTGKPEPEALVQAAGFDVLATFVRRIGGGALGLRVDTDAEQTVWLDPTLRGFQKMVDEKLPGRVNRISCRRCGEDDMVALVFSYSDREPGHYYVVRDQGREWQSVGRVRPAIDAEQMARVDYQRIKARDGRDLPVWMTLPKGVKPGQPAPTVMLVHGGPWVRIGHWRWSSDAQFLASRGYLVIEPDFRGSDGYGRDHLEAGFKQFGQTMQDDVADALLWARKQGLASDKACIAGASYGGYATLAGLFRHPELYRCGLAWVAVTDLMLMTQGSPFAETDVGRGGRRHSYAVMVGDPQKDAEMLRAYSPVHQAASIKAPVMLAMGEADLRVPLAHGTRFRDAMQAAGNPVEWVTYRSEGHGWFLEANRIDFAQRMERFFAQHLRQP